MIPRVHFVFDSHKEMRGEVTRILGQISDRANFLARKSQVPGDGEVHEVRLLIKRLRARLWFSRPALGSRP